MSSTTYRSTNSRRCMSCLQVGFCLNTCPDRSMAIPPVTQLMVGEIDMPDGTKHLYVAETPKFHQVKLLNRPMRNNSLSMTGVIKALDKGAEMPAEAPGRVPRVPMRHLVSTFLGMVLTAMAMVALSQDWDYVLWETIVK